MTSLRYRLPLIVPLFALLLVLTIAAGCSGSPWNDPYPTAEAGSNTLYTSFSERPKHLDPVQSYAENEFAFIANIYQPPLQYHYLKRPYELIPFGAEVVPKPVYLDAAGRRLPDHAPAERVAFSEYVIAVKKGVLYQPHPALAVDEAGKPRYHALSAADLRGIDTLGDFKHTGTRELVAAIWPSLPRVCPNMRSLISRRISCPECASSTVILMPCAYAENIRNSPTGWRCRFLRRCRRKPIASTASRD